MNPTQNHKADTAELTLRRHTETIHDPICQGALPINEVALAIFLTDLRHYCDRYEINIYTAFQLSYNTYLHDKHPTTLENISTPPTYGSYRPTKAKPRSRTHSPNSTSRRKKKARTA